MITATSPASRARGGATGSRLVDFRAVTERDKTTVAARHEWERRYVNYAANG